MRHLPPTLPLWLAGALLLVLAQQPWWQVSWAATATAGAGSGSLSGTAATGGLAQAIALVALAGAAATLVLRRVGRRTVGVLLALAHTGAAALGFAHPRPGEDAVREALGAAWLADAWRIVPSVWPWAYGACAVIGVLGALLLVARPVAESSRSVRGPAAQVEDSLASWKAMDEGLDPTD